MKTSVTRFFRLLILLNAILLVGVSAQTTAPSLALELYAGLTITGTVGTVYSVEYTSDFGQTNSPASWLCLEFVRLSASPFLWTDKAAPATGKRFYRATVFSAPTNLVFIPPGTFRMGTPTNETDRYYIEGPQTDVTISRGFWMAKYLVTQGEYLDIMGTNPSAFAKNKPTPEDLLLPVESLSWADANKYCAALTQRDRTAGRIPANSVYRLPTEAEWEYACRAQSSTRFYYGDDPDYTNLTDYAWCEGNSGAKTHAVGQKLPNVWGLYDMHGNVWEWCQDWYDAYHGGIALDPQGPVRGVGRVIRGGSWSDVPKYCRSGNRSYSPLSKSFYVGFRIVLVAGQP